MDIDQLDQKLITEPLTYNERTELIKLFINQAYLKGIDRGTLLEQTRQARISMVNKKMFEKKYEAFLDKIEDLVNIYQKRVYREKYKGRYNYYKRKKPKKKQPSKYKQNQLW